MYAVVDIEIDIGFYTVSAKYLPLKSNLLHFFKKKTQEAASFPSFEDGKYLRIFSKYCHFYESVLHVTGVFLSHSPRSL